MKVSIITPCYNAQEFISETISSVLAQTYKNFELIIVDDGSSDSSVEIIKSFNDDRIKLIERVNSGKPSIPRNAGIKASTGDIICFLDADDFYCADRLQKVMDLFIRFPAIDYVFHDHSYTDEKLNITNASHVHSSISNVDFTTLMQEISLNTYKPKASLFKSFLFNKQLICTDSIIIRKSSYKPSTLLFNEQLTCAEDILLWCSIISYGKGLYIDEALSFYRNNTTSVTKDVGQVDYDTYKFYQIILQNPFEPLSLLERKTLKNRAISDILSAAYVKEKEGYKDIAHEMLLEAIKFSFSPVTIKAFAKNLIRKLIKR